MIASKAPPRPQWGGEGRIVSEAMSVSVRFEEE